MRTTLEHCIAACVLMSGGKLIRALDVCLNDFADPVSRAILCAAGECDNIDPVIVAARHKGKIAVSEITALLQTVPTANNFVDYQQQFKEMVYKEKLRELRIDLMSRAKTAGNLLELAADLAAQEQALREQYLKSDSTGDLLDVAAEIMTSIEKGIDPPDLLPFRVGALDDLHGGGLLPNELVVIGARPSTGKTALALQICADCGQKTVFFSLEMSKRQVVPRLLAAAALQNVKIAMRQPSKLDTETRNNLLSVAPELYQICDRIRVYEKADQNIDSIRRLARKEVAGGARLVLIDYLQLIECEAENRERAVAKVSRALKNMSKELNVPVICLAQLSRDCEKNNRPPILSDLRESGAIEQDANSILFLHLTGKTEAEKNRPTAEIAFLLEKGRDVGKGFKTMIFNRNHQRFYEKDTHKDA